MIELVTKMNKFKYTLKTSFSLNQNKHKRVSSDISFPFTQFLQ